MERILELPSDIEISNMCGIVSRQTNYTIDEIKDKLIEYDYVYMDVIKEYMGVKKEKPKPIKSLNQEIYRQIRIKLDDATRDFNQKQYEKIVAEINEDIENN
jgi:hypothetical protein